MKRDRKRSRFLYATKDAVEKSVSLQEADNKIRNVLRYTMLRDEKNFTDGYFATQDALIKNGYRIERVKNTWGCI